MKTMSDLLKRLPGIARYHGAITEEERALLDATIAAMVKAITEAHNGGLDAALDEARKNEREKCAQVAEAKARYWRNHGFTYGSGDALASEIREGKK